jgi:hypothetical protein
MVQKIQPYDCILEVIIMPDYKTLYYNLFNSIGKTIERFAADIEILKKIQQEAEERLINDDCGDTDE